MSNCPSCNEPEFPGGLYFEKEISLLIPQIKIQVEKLFQFWFIGRWTIPVDIDIETPEIGVKATGKACGKCKFLAVQDIRFATPFPVKSVSVAKKK
jgi:hypothetical protein